ncbi:DUF2589 domain-containing protein [Geovibrio ferrireducens]|jgi:hypothetical protein|uniref:DUF2589 domain-containing protein n=1 Tax=Geovibrio ferrireducens TaxID=46201 RepID=UPI00224659A1|nr:DUF2589 domain-containing protein [Geovibrio ferrireducens]
MFWKQKTEDTQTFSDLIRGLQHSISSAMEMIEARNIEILGRYFDPRTGEPVTRRLRLDEDTVIDVPLISVVNPSTLNIKEVEMDFSVRVNQTELKQRQPDTSLLNNSDNMLYANRVERSSLNVSFGGKGESVMNVRVKFRAAPIPEGMSRIITDFDKTIEPRKETDK